jgi:alpha-tubulin suppressor-like RCC1 family protein
MPVNYSHAVLLSWDGQVLTCGKNTGGELGNGDDQGIMTDTFSPIAIDKKFISVAAGYDRFCVAVADDGSLWTWGSPEETQLDISIERACVPRQIPETRSFLSVSAGDSFTLCLDETERVWTFGKNHKGQLGFDTKDEYCFIPTMCPTLNHIRKIAAGGFHSLCLDQDGNVWSFRSNCYGQLGVKGIKKRFTPGKILRMTIIAPVIDICAGSNHTLLLNCNSDAWACGDNQYCQLGVSSESESESKPIQQIPLGKISRIWCGAYHSFVLDCDGQLFVFGRAYTGNDSTHIEIPTVLEIDFIVRDIVGCDRFSFLVDNFGNVHRTDVNGIINILPSIQLARSSSKLKSARK